MYVGWVWLRGEWADVCRASTVGECHRLLNRECDRLCVKDRDAAITTGSTPVTSKETRRA
jgi:hypothetical protein